MARRIDGAYYAEKEKVRAIYAVADEADAYYAVAPTALQAGGMTADELARYERIQARFAELMRKRDAERQGRR